MSSIHGIGVANSCKISGWVGSKEEREFRTRILNGKTEHERDVLWKSYHEERKKKAVALNIAPEDAGSRSSLNSKADFIEEKEKPTGNKFIPVIYDTSVVKCPRTKEKARLPVFPKWNSQTIEARLKDARDRVLTETRNRERREGWKKY